MREPGSGAPAEIDFRAGGCGEFTMARDEVGVKMGFDDVLETKSVLARLFEVNVYISLRVDDGGDASRT